MRMIAWTCRAKAPEVVAKNEVCELAPELPPMFPEAPPIVGINGGCAVDCLVLENPCKAEQEALRGGPVAAKQLKFGSLGEHQKRNLVQLVAQRDSEGLEERFVHAVSNRRPLQLVRFFLHPDAGGRFDQRIDRRTCQAPKRRAATARMRNRGMVLQKIDFALQVNLNDLLVQCRPGKMAGRAFAEEQMEDNAIKGGVLRVTVTVPVCDVHIQFDVALEQ